MSRRILKHHLFDLAYIKSFVTVPRISTGLKLKFAA